MSFGKGGDARRSKAGKMMSDCGYASGGAVKTKGPVMKPTTPVPMKGGAGGGLGRLEKAKRAK